MNAVFDSCIVIDYLNGVPEAKAELDLYEKKSISLITWMEVMSGTDKTDENDTRDELFRYECLPITFKVAELAVTLRKDSRLKLPDAIILATAQAADLLFVTRSTRDFMSLVSQVRIPYTL